MAKNAIVPVSAPVFLLLLRWHKNRPKKEHLTNSPQ
jgi:hypothetical protein